MNNDDFTSNLNVTLTLPEEDPEFRDLPEKFKCVKCSKLLRLPYQSICGHYFCEDCKNIRHCPIADNDCIEAENSKEPDEPFVIFDNALRRELARQIVYCNFKSKGCTKETQWRNLTTHTENCDYAVYPCAFIKYGCDETEIKTKPHYLAHISNCKFHPDNEIDCSYGCGKKIKVKDQKDHLNDCKNVDIDCPLKDLGCSQVKASRHKIEEHLRTNSCFHFGLLAEEPTVIVDVMYRDLLNITKEVRELRDEIKNKDKKIEELQDLILNVKQNSERYRSSDSSYTSPTVLSTVHQLEVDVAMLKVNNSEMNEYINNIEKVSTNGTLMWKINNYQQRKKDAKSRKALSIYSPPFFSTKFGYKMCARAYLNGDGSGKDRYFSLFFVIMKGDYDDLLKWPFQQKITLMILDLSGHNRHIHDTFKPDPASSSFKKPTADMNIASGSPQFVRFDILERPDNGYLKDDTILIKVVVDTSGLKDP